MAEQEGGMIERVAVAIWVARGDYPQSGVGVKTMWPVIREGLMKQARAAIEAMREPTQAMLNNACPVEDKSGAPYVYDRAVTAELYRACIEAALDQR